MNWEQCFIPVKERERKNINVIQIYARPSQDMCSFLICDCPSYCSAEFPPPHTQIVHYTYLIFFSAYGIVYMADMQQKFEFYANNIIIAFLTL